MILKEITSLMELGFTQQEAERYFYVQCLRDLANREYKKTSAELDLTVRQRYFDTVMTSLQVLTVKDDDVIQINFDIDDINKTYRLTPDGRELLKYDSESGELNWTTDSNFVLCTRRTYLNKCYDSTIKKLFKLYQVFTTYQLQTS